MLFVQYKFRRIEHNNTHTLFQFITCARLTLVEDTTKYRSVKSLQHKLPWCTICCPKFEFRTCTPCKTQNYKSLSSFTTWRRITVAISSDVHGRTGHNAKSPGSPAPVQTVEGNPVHLVRTVHEVRSGHLGQLTQPKNVLHGARATRILSQHLELIPATLLDSAGRLCCV